MKKTYLILFIAISLVGLVSGIYLKYFKIYQNDILINDEVSQQRQLNLRENIDYLEELNRTFAVNGVERTHTDMLPEALKRLKTINGISIGLIMVSGLLFLWSVQKFYKTRRFHSVVLSIKYNNAPDK